MNTPAFQITPLEYDCIDYKSRKLLSVRGSIILNTSKENVWKIITTPGYLENIHPFCKHHLKVEYTGVGIKDRGTFHSGKELNRELIEWHPNESYTFLVTDKKNKLSRVKFAVQEVPNKQTKLLVHIKTEAFKNVPRPFWKWLAKRKILPRLKKYLHSLLNGAKYYSETGKPVFPNQFGHLKPFSKK